MSVCLSVWSFVRFRTFRSFNHNFFVFNNGLLLYHSASVFSTVYQTQLARKGMTYTRQYEESICSLNRSRIVHCSLVRLNVLNLLKETQRSAWEGER
jgi:hypothetical protein